MQLNEETVAVVTGAGGGLGQAIACELAKRGCRLVLVDIDGAGLSRTRRLLKHCTASFHVFDIADACGIESLAGEVGAYWGRVDLLINNAGVSAAAPFEKSELLDFHWVMDVNFWGVIYACRSFLPLLRKAKQACICNVLSSFALLGFPTKSAYAASKFAVRGFSESLQMDLHDTCIGVTCVYVGAVRTSLVRNGRSWDGDKQEAEADFLSRNGMEPATGAQRICRAIIADRSRVRIGCTTFAFDGLARFIPALSPRIVGAAKKRIRFV